MALLKRISDKTPGLNLRIAIQRHLDREPRDLRPLATELGFTAGYLLRWLRDDPTLYRVGVSSITLKTLDNYNKSQKKKKKGRPFGHVDEGLVQRIKDYGIERYVEKLLRDNRAAIREAARALTEP